MARLLIYISEDCWTLPETRRLAVDVASHFPDVAITFLNQTADWPDHIFATPTYVLDGRVIFLGNPTREALRQALAADRQMVNDEL